MANARPPGNAGAGGTPQLRLGIDVSRLRADTNQVTQSFRAMSRDTVQIAREQSRQVTVLLRSQQAQITADARAGSQERIQLARAESIARQQQARADTQIAIQEEKRKTAALTAELRAQARARTSGQNLATFAGAALGGPIGGLAGALAGGSPALAAGLAVSQGARFITEQAGIAVAYDRQRVAAVNLAGSQARLNALLAAYDRAAGGSVARTEALANVTKLMAVGFADNAQELEQFTRAIRGISIAMGTSQDTVTQNLVLELFSQRGMRLDQLGLLYDKVRQRADELRAADATLTQQQAYQNAVLEQAEQRYGKLADSAEGQRSGAEKLSAAWSNYGLTIGEIGKGPVNFLAEQLANSINISTQNMLNFLRVINQVNVALGITSRTNISPLKDPSGHSVLGRQNAAANPTFNADQIAALRRREEGFTAITRNESRARADEIENYNRQVANITRTYQKNSVREAEDFARQRLYAERKLNLSILDVARDSARERTRWQAETERQIGEIQERYARAQMRRERDFRDKQLDAAGRLDAKAIAEQQRDFLRENQDAKDARDEQIADQRAALQRRIDEQRENDAQRIEDMRAAFEEQKAQEDAERAIRLQRQAEDHSDQLIELARQHADRIQQIREQAAEERAQWEDQSNRALADVGIFNDKWLAEQDRINAGVLQRHLALLNAQRNALLNPSALSPADPSYNLSGAAPYVPPAPTPNAISNKSSIGHQISITIPIQAAPGQSPYDIADAVDKRLFYHLEQLGK